MQSASAAPIAAQPTFEVEKLAADLDAYMAAFGKKLGPAYAPSGILVVAHAGEPKIVRAYGASQLGGAPPTLDTRFRIGSITKQFTAATVMKLVDEGKLTLNESIRTYVSELPESFKPVTLAHLLQHRAGVLEYTDVADLMARKSEEVPQADVLSAIGKKAPSLTPGYSNSHYYLLSVAVERVTKQKFEEVLTQKVLGPTGMRATSSDAKGTDIAVGYMRSPAEEIVPADVVSSALPFGAGFLRSTARDFLLWDRALVGTTVLSDAAKASVFTPDESRRGFGWVIEPIDGTNVLWHSGAIDGFGSYFARIPERDVAVVFLSNRFEFEATRVGVDVVRMVITRAAVAGPEEPNLSPVTKEIAETAVGDFVLSKAARKELEAKVPVTVLDSIEGLSLSWDGARLFAKPIGQSALPVKRRSDVADKIVVSNFATRVDIEIPALAKGEKKVRTVTLKQGPFTIIYERGKLPKPKATKAAPKPDAAVAKPTPSQKPNGPASPKK